MKTSLLRFCRNARKCVDRKSALPDGLPERATIISVEHFFMTEAVGTERLRALSLKLDRQAHLSKRSAGGLQGVVQLPKSLCGAYTPAART